LSLCAITIVESTSSTTTPAPMSCPAAWACGTCLISVQTRVRTFARAALIRRSCAAPISSKARQHVAGDATGPNTSP
jgi:hypothetical protein